MNYIMEDKIKEITKLILKKVKYVVLDADALTCFKNDLKSLYLLLDKNKSTPKAFTYL